MPFFTHTKAEGKPSPHDYYLCLLPWEWWGLSKYILSLLLFGRDKITKARVGQWNAVWLRKAKWLCDLGWNYVYGKAVSLNLEGNENLSVLLLNLPQSRRDWQKSESERVCWPITGESLGKTTEGDFLFFHLNTCLPLAWQNRIGT